MILKRNDIIEDLEGKPMRVAKAPLDCGETLCEGDRWPSVIQSKND